MGNPIFFALYVIIMSILFFNQKVQTCVVFCGAGLDVAVAVVVDDDDDEVVVVAVVVLFVSPELKKFATALARTLPNSSELNEAI